MASARPTAYKKGGGFLHNVDGVIVDYKFTTERPGSTAPSSRRSDFSPLFCVLSVKVDGADEAVTTSLFVGSADDFAIENDGKTLAPIDDSVGIRATSEWGVFMTSLIQGGFDENRLPDDRINYEAILGTRARFVQVANAEKTKKLGKRKGKDGKGEYDRTDMVVERVYAMGGAAPARRVNGAPAAKTTAAASDDLDAIAADTLLEVLDQQPQKSIAKAKMGLQLLKALKSHPKRQDLYAHIMSDAFLAGEQGWTYHADTQTVSL